MNVTKIFRTETAHRLQDHPGRCSNIHGHSYVWEVMLSSPQLTLGGMVEDFGCIKEVAGSIIDQYDHALVLEDNDLFLDLFTKQSKQRLIIFGAPPTAENMAYKTAHEIQDVFPLHNVSVKIWETATSYAEYKTP